MLTYPSISKTITDIPIYAFDKHDGSNIRVEWTPKTGFSKFGSRTRLIADGDPLEESISLFEQNFSSPLESLLMKTNTQRATFFLEFYGENSFAGQHRQEEHFLSLFDVSFFKKGFLLPEEFMHTFFDIVPTSPLLYQGKVTEGFLREVKEGTLPGMTFEGVVCKSQELVRNKQVKFKVKNQEWLDKLKNHCHGNTELFNTLS